MKVHWTVSALVLPLLLVFALSDCPVDSAISVGGDDGFELQKELLLARHPEMAARLDNDQPWLHTIVTAGLMRFFGEHAAIPRLLSAASTLALLLALGYLSHECAGALGVVLVGAFYLSCESVTTHALAAMLEVPALSWGVVAATMLIAAERDRKRWPHWITSIILFALALHIKLTAMLVVSGIVAYLIASRGVYRGLFLGIVLGVVCAFLFVCIGLLCPTFSYRSLWGSHMAAESALTIAQAKASSFHWYYLSSQLALVLATTMGIVLGIVRRHPILTFGIVFLTTSIAVAIVHRPWWGYYLVHLYIPMSLLGGVATANVAQILLRGFWKRKSEANEVDMLSQVTAERGSCNWWSLSLLYVATCVALWCGFTLPRWIFEVKNLCRLETADNAIVLRAMRQYQRQTHWCYSSEGAWAFQGGMLVPPELVLLTSKRFLSGSLTIGKVLDIARRYNPEVVLLNRAKLSGMPEWEKWVEADYVLCEQDPVHELWVARRLAPRQLGEHDERLRHLGL